MKKLLLISFLLLFAGLKGFCGNNLNLQFTDSLVTDNGTCYIGSSYKLYVYIKNDGPDTFNGPIAFKVYVAKTKDIDIASPQYTFVLDSDGANNYIIPPHGNATYTKDIVIEKQYFPKDTTVIVIVWPSGSAKPATGVLQDNYIADNFCTPYQQVYISSKAKPKAVPASGNMSFYPNPAGQVLNLNFATPAEGIVKVIDLNGRMVSQHHISNGISNYNVNLSSTDRLLPEGVYIISYETADYIETKKFIIQH